MADQDVYRTKYTLAFQRSPRGMGKAFKASRAGIFKAIGKHWHKQMLPQHFKADSDEKYGYKRRSKGYRRKKEARGERRSLVWTGDLMAKTKGFAKIRSSTAGVKVAMQTPNWLRRMKGPVRNTRTIKGRTFQTIGPDIRGEITTISNEESAEISKAARKRLKNVMKNSKDRRKIVV
jgi:hypothetical protein